MTFVDANAVMICWRRRTVRAAISLYAALSMRAGEPLLTSDMRLARTASETGIAVRKP